MEELASAVVGAEGQGARLDRYASEVFEPWLGTRSSARKAVKRGEVLLNHAVAGPSRFLAVGDVITLLPRVDRPATWDHPVTVLVEDEHLAVVHKPAGLPVNGNKHRTLEHALPASLWASTMTDAFPWPRPVHRLDVRTEGVVIVAKTRSAHVGLTRALQAREIDKRYVALVEGRLEGEGRIEEPLEGREALTLWSALEHNRSLKTGWVTTLGLQPITGRTHQLRRHLTGIGHAILGDTLYPPVDHEPFRGKGLHLCAVRVSFGHPVTSEPVVAQIDEPAKFGAFRRREDRRWLRYYG